MPVGQDGFLPFHENGRKTLSGRFQQLGNAISAIPGMTLLNSLNSTGGYAWIHCEGPLTCQEEFSKVNVTGLKGSLFGASDQGKRIVTILKSRTNDINSFSIQSFYTGFYFIGERVSETLSGAKSGIFVCLCNVFEGMYVIMHFDPFIFMFTWKSTLFHI